MASDRISIYSLPDLKNTSDDAIPNYLNSLKFKQNHNLTDVRLSLGYAAIITAGVCFAWDYYFGFEATKNYTAIAVALYASLNGLMTLWSYFFEMNIVYEGTAPDGSRLSISTSTNKGSPNYKINATVISKAGKPRTMEFQAPFSAWFDETGRFVALPFQQMLATNVALIGSIDPERVVDIHKQLSGMSPEMLDALLAGASNNSAATTTATEANTTIEKRR
ncbi:hypothetical protein Cpir12675_000151 [Ceratocystis pirilliformis]|uniref:Signal peptidase complex subunit 2 n=1 Tax=Ceratocystis pirilliformis TaxID=259994 RepID=A0ABR3ZNP9_9PEZI